MLTSLMIPAFIAGLITFLAPCTFPLVPGYLGFIGGASIKDLKDPNKVGKARRNIFLNGVYYVLGFSLVFILLGSIFGAAGSFLGQHRIILSRIGGLFVMFFGLYLMHVFELPLFRFMQSEHRFNVVRRLTPGKPSSSFIFGMTFAFGWTPCVGPVLGSVLILASSSTTALTGAALLLVFSAGLAVPFLLLALAVGHAGHYVQRMNKHLNTISFIGGILLIVLGYLLATDQLGIWVGYFYEIFGFIHAERLFDFL